MNKADNGTLYFITGLSGAGKTTVGKYFYDKMKAIKPNVVMLDGDELRAVYGSEIKYSTDDRCRLAMRNARLCLLLTAQGIDVICCTIAMFHTVREWNRENIKNYKEIYLRVTMDTLKQRNQKKLYSENTANVVGLTMDFEAPRLPDLLIDNDGADSALQVAEQIYDVLIANKKESISYKNYWDDYYTKKLAPSQPSLFAQFALQYMSPNDTLLEIGCGNARDSLYFCAHDIKVTAVDQSKLAFTSQNNFTFIQADFINAEIYINKNYNCVYSRFTLHSVSANEETKLLRNVFTALAHNGHLFIEVRSTDDELFGKGEQVDRNAFVYNSHYRRFVVLQELLYKLEAVGFRVVFKANSRGFAPFGTENPKVIRIVAQKP